VLRSLTTPPAPPLLLLLPLLPLRLLPLLPLLLLQCWQSGRLQCGTDWRGGRQRSAVWQLLLPLPALPLVLQPAGCCCRCGCGWAAAANPAIVPPPLFVGGADRAGAWLSRLELLLAVLPLPAAATGLVAAAAVAAR
jgi:hypothetical protein